MRSDTRLAVRGFTIGAKICCPVRDTMNPRDPRPFLTVTFPFRSRLPLLLILICSFLATASYALPPPRIGSISVEGNSHVGTREILEWLSSRPGLELSEEILKTDVRTIKEEYRRLGYFGAGVDSISRRYRSDSSFVDLAIMLHEGRLTVLGAARLAGVRLFTGPEVLEVFLLEPGDPFDESLLEADINALLQKYERRGYALAGCSIASLELKRGDGIDSIDVLLDVEEGPLVTVDEVRVEGNDETAAEVVVREARLKPDEIFDPEKPGAIQRRLQRLNIFSSVSEPELYLRGEKGGFLIRVQEGSSNTFDGIVGYVPGATAEESGYVTGLASVAMRNLFGTGRKFSFRWAREDRHSQELGVRYLEPWLFGYPVNLSAGFYQRQQDTTFVRRVIDPKAELMVTEEFSVALFFVTEAVIPRAETTIERVLRTSTQTVGGELLYDTRDDPYSPTSGARYRTDYQFGTQRVSDIPAGLSDVRSRLNIQKFGLDLDFFLSTFSRQVVAAGLHGRELRSDQVDEAQMYRFGGARSLRGYRENQFLGSRIAWSNAEYRFLLARRSFLFGFVDAGYYFRPADELHGLPSSESFKYGYGVGVQVETGLGILGVSYALGEGDSFSAGKVHFGLINEF
jgi:outer membrane protein insertion porin family